MDDDDKVSAFDLSQPRAAFCKKEMTAPNKIFNSMQRLLHLKFLFNENDNKKTINQNNQNHQNKTKIGVFLLVFFFFLNLWL